MAFDGIITKIVADYGEKETEHNWERVEEGFKKATLLVEKQSAEVLCAALKKVKSVLVPSLLTERTRLSTAAMEFVKALCGTLGSGMDQFGECLLPPILKLCERTNKIFVMRATQTLNAYVKVAPVPKTVLPRLAEALRSVNKGLRSVAAEVLENLVETAPGEGIAELYEPLEKVLVEALSDAAPQVRETSRRIYFGYRLKHAESAKRILDATAASVQKLLLEGPKEPSASSMATKRPVRPTPTGGSSSSSVPPANMQHASRVIRPNNAPPSIGGAVRVLKPCDSPHLTPGAKAARIIPEGKGSHPQTPVRLRPSASVDSHNSVRPPSSLANCVSAFNLPALSTATSIRPEIVAQLTNVRSADWAVRHKAYEALSELMCRPDTPAQVESSKPALQRLVDMFGHGLTDTHFRVLEAAIQYGLDFLSHCPVAFFADTLFIDNALSKIIYLSLNPQFKGKACQEQAPLLVDRISSWMADRWKFCGSLAVAYLKPEAATSVKTRTWIISRITEECDKIDFSAYSENELTFNLKTVILRISGALLDHDQSLVQGAIQFFHLVQRKLNDKSIFEGLTNSIKFASARAILQEGLAKLAGQEKGEGEEQIGQDRTLITDQVEDMKIVTEDDPEPIVVDQEYIVLDSELGIELRCRQRTATPPIEELTRALDSVLQSPFPNDHPHPVLKQRNASSMSLDVEGDDVEMTSLAPAAEQHDKILRTPAEEEDNPFIST